MGKISDALEKSNRDKKPEDGSSLEMEGAVKKGAGSSLFHPDTPKPSNDAGGFSNDPGLSRKIPVNKEPVMLSSAYGELHKNLIAFHSPQTVEAEQFRILKTSIMFPEKGESPKTIMVTSAVPSEGKSFVAANLAISLAQNIDNHVLLIDCDMRLPTIHKLFGLKDGTPGLSSYLSGEQSLQSLLSKTSIEKLTLLPGGRPPHNPSELLSSERMTHLLDELKSRYHDRFVVIDTPPPQLTAEAGALAKQVDGILIVIKYGTTSRVFVKELIELFGKEKILGIVFNQYDRTKTVGYGYGYGQYGAYGGYYGTR